MLRKKVSFLILAGLFLSTMPHKSNCFVLDATKTLLSGIFTGAALGSLGYSIYEGAQATSLSLKDTTPENEQEVRDERNIRAARCLLAIVGSLASVGIAESIITPATGGCGNRSGVIWFIDGSFISALLGLASRK